MGRAGRKRKSGPRTASGRLKRDNYPEARRDNGTEWVQAMRARFGVHYNTALGRAYAAGLLGDEEIARVRYDAGKKFARLYSAIIQVGVYKCPLGRDTLATGGQDIDHPHAREDQDWLFSAADDLEAKGGRPWLDQLITIQHVDQGPSWLDDILAGGKDPFDYTILQSCIDALDIISPAQRPARILSAVY